MRSVRGSTSSAAAAEDVRPLEMWAGVECTINRVGPTFRDQLQHAGHYNRLDDIDRIAALGVRTVRYPILWERHDANDAAWSHTDRVMERFRAHGIDVIAGLVHHGSGPAHTDLLDPGFADGLAAYARRVATRYPWLRRFTPINEPLTTARFAALYGMWYPHRKSDRAFVMAMLNQAIATQRAMSAIRDCIPDAELVQTEDLAYIHATPTLAYQARFENARRWLTFDLLTGRVRKGHRLWSYLRRSAPVGDLLDSIAATATDRSTWPAVIGVNHYLTSERFLDERIGSYPWHLRGGNRRHRYVDVEAVRVLPAGPMGAAALLGQAWERFRIPIAITEAHLACTREQQMLWLHEMWSAARQARHQGANVVAVTAWSAFGAFDWRTLLTKEELAYESGLYDLRARAPRATALVPMVRELATTGHFEHPALAARPWWKRSERILYPHPHRATMNSAHDSSGGARGRPILITGAHGTLGRAFTTLADERGLHVAARGRREMDVADRNQVRAALDECQPWAVINTAGFVRVDHAEHEIDACRQANAIGSQVLADECSARGIAFVTFSSDLVFDGIASKPYVESDAPTPLNVYGRSKAEAERLVLASMPDALVVRTSAFFGDWDDWNFVSRSLAVLQNGGIVHAPDDAVVSPTYISDLVHATLDLLIDGESGVWHLANVGALSWTDLARMAAASAKLDVQRIEPCASRDIGWTAPRPGWSVLGSERATLLPDLDDAIARYARSRAWERVARTLETTGAHAGHPGPGTRTQPLHATR